MPILTSLLHIHIETYSAPHVTAALAKSITDKITENLKSEIHSAIEKLQADFTHTTDFLEDEQRDIKENIKATETKIKDLESENIKLKQEINLMGGRLRSLEKISRSCNAEVHCVTERNQEDLLLVLKKMCDLIGSPLSFNSILSARRVAKINPSSNRPRNILVTFTGQYQRDQMMESFKAFNRKRTANPLNTSDLGLSDENKIYMVEHSSPEVKKLHADTREKLRHSYKFIWIKYGRVYARKTEGSTLIHIADHSVLNNLV